MLVVMGLGAPCVARGDEGRDSPQPVSDRQLAGAVSNPTVPLTQVQLRDVVAPAIPGFEGTGNVLQFQAVIPVLPSDVIPFALLMKLTIPIVSLPGPAAQTALGNVQFFVQAAFAETWGGWGVGVAAVFPTQTASGALSPSVTVPPGTWQLGPAAALILTGIPNLVVGGVFQNPIALSSQNPANVLLFSPSISYSLPGGWFAGWSDFNWSVNWEQGAAVTLSVGLQVGKVVRILDQPFSLSVEGGYNVLRPSNGDGVPYWMAGFALAAIFHAL